MKKYLWNSLENPCNDRVSMLKYSGIRKKHAKGISGRVPERGLWERRSFAEEKNQKRRIKT